MQVAHVNGVDLEFDDRGAGDPVLLISPVLADGFVPLVAQRSLADDYRLIRYHKRGWVGSTHSPPPVTVADHAADAAALLDHLGIGRSHLVGHSSGAAVAAQLALDAPDRVATLTLLELSLLSVPAGTAFLEQAGPAFEAYTNGDHEDAIARFVSLVSGMKWERCRQLLERRIPGAVAQAVKDADTFFGVELPALGEWSFGAEQAASIDQPTLSMLGTDTQPLWFQVAEVLTTSLPDVEEQRIQGVGHLLHIENPKPVAEVLADFLRRHPIEG